MAEKKVWKEEERFLRKSLYPAFLGKLRDKPYKERGVVL